LCAVRDAAVLKTVYAFGLRRTEASRSDVTDLRRNRKAPQFGRAKAIQALRTLDTEGSPVTFDALARAARLSRSWLYAQADIRAKIERLRVACRRAPATQLPARQVGPC
jgi:hypothetical protein